MHIGEVDTSVALVRRLIAAQYPEFVGLEITAEPSAGTDNALYRLGDELVVRLPRIQSAAVQLEKEQKWLPFLKPRLTLSIPEVAAIGAPAEGFPWPWSVYRWLDGEDATTAAIDDWPAMAHDLAEFIRELRSIDASGGPEPGMHNAYRGVPLAQRDDRTRACIAELAGSIDAEWALAVWNKALAADGWSGQPVWLHGDLQAGNLLIKDGRISSVIDFGCSGVGDPACDVMAAWLFLDRSARQPFRDALEVDDATWTRARGWALSMGVIALPYYRQSNPTLAGIAQRAIQEALSDIDD